MNADRSADPLDVTMVVRGRYVQNLGDDGRPVEWSMWNSPSGYLVLTFPDLEITNNTNRMLSLDFRLDYMTGTREFNPRRVPWPDSRQAERPVSLELRPRKRDVVAVQFKLFPVYWEYPPMMDVFLVTRDRLSGAEHHVALGTHACGGWML